MAAEVAKVKAAAAEKVHAAETRANEAEDASRVAQAITKKKRLPIPDPNHNPTLRREQRKNAPRRL